MNYAGDKHWLAKVDSRTFWFPLGPRPSPPPLFLSSPALIFFSFRFPLQTVGFVA